MISPRMGPVRRFCFLPMVLLLLAVGSTQADRLPLQRTSKKKIKTGPLPYELKPWETRVDPKPRVVDLGKGKYGFRWIGSRGQELQVIFERPDMIDVVVEASVVPASGGQLGYRYRVRSLRSSLQLLRFFVVQTFSESTIRARDPRWHAGRLKVGFKEYSEGQWLTFGFLDSVLKVPPGEAVEVTMKSTAPPGIVKCASAGGFLGMKAAEEAMPEVFLYETNLPNKEAWPSGFTIGPDSRLAGFSQAEKVKYLVDQLPEMLRLGWIRDREIMQWYQENLRPGEWERIRTQAKEDNKKGLITAEVLALLTHND